MHIEELIDNLSFLEDWEERYRYIIELGRQLPSFPEDSRIESNKVKGCMSQVWMIPEVRDEDAQHIHFLADSDAHIVKGLIAVLLTIYSGKTSAEILDTNIEDIFSQMGLS
ncbi:MAG: SufE family protein, partial [Myxococcota bacterium]